MASSPKTRIGNSERATLARARIAGACRGVHTGEFRSWRQRAQAIADEHLTGVRSPMVKSKQSARHRGWMAAEQEFREKHSDRVGDLIGFSSQDSAKPIRLIDEVRWAYRHAMVYSTTEIDAPSAGAWLWLLEVRENRSQFLGRMFALEQAAHGGKLPQYADDDDSGLDDEGISLRDLLSLQNR